MARYVDGKSASCSKSAPVQRGTRPLGFSVSALQYSSSTPAVLQQYSSRTPVCLMFTYIILYIYNVDLVYVFDRFWMRVELRSLSLQGWGNLAMEVLKESGCKCEFKLSFQFWIYESLARMSQHTDMSIHSLLYSLAAIFQNRGFCNDFFYV